MRAHIAADARVTSVRAVSLGFAPCVCNNHLSWAFRVYSLNDIIKSNDGPSFYALLTFLTSEASATRRRRQISNTDEFVLYVFYYVFLFSRI